MKLSTNIIKELKKQKRQKSYLLFLDNIKIIKDALNIGLKPLYILTTNEDKLDFEIFNHYKDIIYKVDKATIEQLSDSKTPQGVVCIAEYIPNIVVKPKTNFLVLDGLQDPGNVGTLIRTAAACQFNYVYLVDSVNITNPKLIRSSVGSIFNIKVFELSREQFIRELKNWDLPLIKADMKGINIFKFSMKQQLGLVIGNEGQGVSREISQLCNYSVSLPMENNIESLNAGVSGSVIMYEIAKNNFEF